jgi:hypothetical protein
VGFELRLVIDSEQTKFTKHILSFGAARRLRSSGEAYAQLLRVCVSLKFKLKESVQAGYGEAYAQFRKL